MRYLSGFAGLAALLAVMIVGCGDSGGSGSDSGSGGRTKIAYLTNNPSDFWNIARKGVAKAEKELDINVTFKMPPNGTVEEQTRMLESLVAQNYDAVAISPKDASNMTALLNDVAGKLKLICVDSDAPESKRLAYVGTDNYAAGRVLGETLVERVPDGGKIAIFVGTMDAQNAQDRYRGIKDVIKDKGDKFTEIGGQPFLDEIDRAKAKANVESVLTSHQDVAVLIGLWSYNGPAIASAVESAGRKGEVKIICFDEEEETLKGIENGLIEATVVQDPFGFSYEAVKLMHALVTKGDEALPAGNAVYIDARTIDKTNVAEFARNLAELKKGE